MSVMKGAQTQSNFIKVFKAWVKFKNHTTISDEEWQVLSEEDEAHPYEEYQLLTLLWQLQITLLWQLQIRSSVVESSTRNSKYIMKQCSRVNSNVVKNHICIPCMMDLKKHTKKCFRCLMIAFYNESTEVQTLGVIRIQL